jgi:hypothetical protein
MKRTLFIIIYLLSIVCEQTTAQISDLFATPRLPAHNGFVISANGNFDLPFGDMSKRFGISYRVGPAVQYKTKNNWMIGAKFDYISGTIIREDSLLHNLVNNRGGIYNNSGTETGVGIYERGYLIGVSAGKIFCTSRKNGDNGILVQTTAGFIQHKIQYYVSNNDIAELTGDYKKGYDRLTNGVFIEQYVGYNCFARDAFVNFHIGLDVMFGFTQGRRDFQYDIINVDKSKRVDVFFGLRGGWYIPIFKRKSEEYYF